MSLQIRAYTQRSGQMGDPGLFDVIGKALGGVVKVAGGAVGGFLSGGPLGAVKGGISALIPAPKVAAQSFAGLPVLRAGGTTALPGGVPTVSSFGPSSGPGTAMQRQNCTKGYHLNKSAYFHKRLNMWVDEGSACVRNRRMNPLNPRAASRAMRRLDGFSKATRSVEKMMVKMARRNAPKSRGGFGARKVGCGCKKR